MAITNIVSMTPPRGTGFMLTSCIACLFCFCYDLGRYLYDLESFSQSCASSIIVLQSYLLAWRIERRMVRDISQSSAELFDGWGLLRRAVQEVWESCRIALAGATRVVTRAWSLCCRNTCWFRGTLARAVVRAQSFCCTIIRYQGGPKRAL